MLALQEQEVALPCYWLSVKKVYCVSSAWSESHADHRHSNTQVLAITSCRLLISSNWCPVPHRWHHQAHNSNRIKLRFSTHGGVPMASSSEVRVLDDLVGNTGAALWVRPQARSAACIQYWLDVVQKGGEELGDPLIACKKGIQDPRLVYCHFLVNVQYSSQQYDSTTWSKTYNKV